MDDFFNIAFHEAVTPGSRSQSSTRYPKQFVLNYSLVGVVLPNTEMLISRPFAGQYKIRWLLQDRMRTKNVRN